MTAGRDRVELVATLLLAIATEVDVVMLSIGCAVFLFTAVWIATSPISITV